MKAALVLFFFLTGFDVLHAQRFGVKGGLNYSTVSGDNYSYKPGFHVGIFALFNLAENIKLSPEIVYSGQGAKSSGGQFDYNYVNVPVLVNIHETKHIFFQLGAQFGFLTSATSSIGGPSVSVINALNKADVALVGGLGADFGDLIVNARYNWGLIDIEKTSPSPFVPKSDFTTNSCIQISVGVKFN